MFYEISEYDIISWAVVKGMRGLKGIWDMKMNCNSKIRTFLDFSFSIRCVFVQINVIIILHSCCVIRIN